MSNCISTLIIINLKNYNFFIIFFTKPVILYIMLSKLQLGYF